jgi:hypothetical protein
VSDEPTPPDESVERSWRWLMVGTFVILFVCVIGLIVELRSGSDAADAVQSTATQGYDSRIGHPSSKFDITVSRGRLVSGPSTMYVAEGSSVRITIHPIGDEVKVEMPGYNIIAESSPEDDTPGSMAFIADKPGSFKFYSVTDEDDGVSSGRLLLGTVVVH